MWNQLWKYCFIVCKKKKEKNCFSIILNSPHKREQNSCNIWSTDGTSCIKSDERACHESDSVKS